MDKKRTYYGYTTYQQRKLLFETWETTGNISQASRVARVSRGTFYQWKARFEAAGYAGLQEGASHAPHQPPRVAEKIAERVVALRRAHPEWGKTRLANELAKEHSWVAVVSPNTVKRILVDADLWPVEATGSTDAAPASARHADLPGHTVNIDICYLPVRHQVLTKLPAVSGSSGHLVVEQITEAAPAPVWPGQVFSNTEIDYDQAMRQYVNQTADRHVCGPLAREEATTETAAWRRVRAIQIARHDVRQQRRGEDQAWRTAKSAWSQTREQRPTLTPADYRAAATAWQACRHARRTTLAQRQTENAAWHTQLAAATDGEPTPRTWVAVAVVIDNCTRQCLGLPAFTSGAHLTSKELITELTTTLPTGVEYVISDQGCHFRATAFAEFAEERHFTHVLVYRHRPQSNGGAERFVRTLKAELRAAVWDSPEALMPLLRAFQRDYNDRPHQGLPIPGLSPNEYANRAALI